MNEAKVLAALKHPYIVNYRESFMDGHKLCIIMDYAEKGDLFKTIDRARRKFQKLPEAKILRWITQMLLGCKYLHEKHILHRDIKSANVFISASGRCKLGDFGISRVLEHTNCFAKTSIGTPYYLAPEISQQRPYAWPGDIWAAMLQNDAKKRPSAAELLQRPLVQKEIRAMLEEEKASKAQEPAPKQEAPAPKPEAKPFEENKAPRPPTPKGPPRPVAGYPPAAQENRRDGPTPRNRAESPSAAARAAQDKYSARRPHLRSPMQGGGLRY